MFTIIDGSLVFSLVPMDPDTGLPVLDEGEAWIVQERSVGSTYDLFLATSWNDEGKVLEYRYCQRLAYYNEVITKRLIRKVAIKLYLKDADYKYAVAKVEKRNNKYYARMGKKPFWHVPEWFVQMTDKYDRRRDEKAKKFEAIARENNPLYAKIYKSAETGE